MLDYLYRIKKKNGSTPLCFSFFQSINNAVSSPIQTERVFPLSMPYLRPLTYL